MKTLAGYVEPERDGRVQPRQIDVCHDHLCDDCVICRSGRCCAAAAIGQLSTLDPKGAEPMNYPLVLRDFNQLSWHDQRQLTKAEQRAQVGLALVDLDAAVAETKGAIRMGRNHRIVGQALQIETDFYDFALSLAGQSTGKQRLAAQRQAMLVALNDAVIADCCR